MLALRNDILSATDFNDCFSVDKDVWVIVKLAETEPKIFHIFFQNDEAECDKIEVGNTVKKISNASSMELTRTNQRHGAEEFCQWM